MIMNIFQLQDVHKNHRHQFARVAAPALRQVIVSICCHGNYHDTTHVFNRAGSKPRFTGTIFMSAPDSILGYTNV